MLPSEKAAPSRAESLLVVCTLLGTLAVLVPWWRLATFPYQIDYGEGLMLEGALSLRHGQPLYPVASELPIVLHDFGPLAYAATAATLRLGHVSFTAGRVLILALRSGGIGTNSQLAPAMDRFLQISGVWIDPSHNPRVSFLDLPVARGLDWYRDLGFGFGTLLP